MRKDVIFLGLILLVLFSSGCVNTTESDYTIKVSGTEGVEFTGSYMVTTLSTSTSKSVEGAVPAEFNVRGTMVSTAFQKKSESGTLKVEILKEGTEVAQSETTAAYGVVSVASTGVTTSTPSVSAITDEPSTTTPLTPAPVLITTAPPATTATPTTTYPTTTQPPETTPLEKKWFTVKTFEGNGKYIANSPPFHISGERFKITWNYETPNPEKFKSFGLTVEGAGEVSAYEPISSNKPEGEAYIYKGKDDFFIDFSIYGSIGNWKVTVQDYTTEAPAITESPIETSPPTTQSPTESLQTTTASTEAINYEIENLKAEWTLVARGTTVAEGMLYVPQIQFTVKNTGSEEIDSQYFKAVFIKPVDTITSESTESIRDIPPGYSKGPIFLRGTVGYTTNIPLLQMLDNESLQWNGDLYMGEKKEVSGGPWVKIKTIPIDVPVSVLLS